MTTLPTLRPVDLAAIERERVERGAEDRQLNANAPAVASVRNIRLPKQDGLPCRLYEPLRVETLPLLVYLHGGGWSFGSLDSHDRFLRQLSVYARIAILSIGYRLAPEHPYPSARDDVIEIMLGLRDRTILADVGRGGLFLAGDSAGAHIALSAAMKLPRATTNGLILFYGAYRPEFATVSHRMHGRGDSGLTTERVRSYWSAYLHATPLQSRHEADLLACYPGALPNVYIAAAECDPLLSDSLDLAASLARDRVSHQLRVATGARHGYLRRLEHWAAVHEHLAPVLAFINHCCHRSPPALLAGQVSGP